MYQLQYCNGLPAYTTNRTISYNIMAKEYVRLYNVAVIVLPIIIGIFINYNKVSTDIDIIGVCINSVKTTFKPPYQYTNRKLTVGTIVEVYAPDRTHTFPGYIQAIHNTTSSSSSLVTILELDLTTRRYIKGYIHLLYASVVNIYMNQRKKLCGTATKNLYLSP